VAGLWLGIDVGGTKVAFALGEADGSLLAHRRRPTRPSGDPERDVAELAAGARELLAEAGVEVGALAGVGVALPGPLDPVGDRVIAPPNLPGWRDVPVRRWLASHLGPVPIALENDANAAALAEFRFGAGRDHGSLVYLTMSTGVGGGIVADGRIVRGHRWSAGEIGHTVLEWEGEPCACGLRGCVEAYIGGASWARRLAAITPAESRVAQLAGGREKATPRHVVEAAREGDAFALDELERFNTLLARTIVSVVFTVDPQAVLLGTIPTAAGELVFGPVREKVRSHLWRRLAEVEILPVGLGKELPYYAGICAALAALGPEGAGG